MEGRFGGIGGSGWFGGVGGRYLRFDLRTDSTKRGSSMRLRRQQSTRANVVTNGLSLVKFRLLATSVRSQCVRACVFRSRVYSFTNLFSAIRYRVVNCCRLICSFVCYIFFRRYI